MGIYLGAFISSLIVLFYSKKLVLTLIPITVFFSVLVSDVILVQLKFYEYSKTIAFITGLFFGSITFVYILSVFENSFLEYSSGNK